MSYKMYTIEVKLNKILVLSISSRWY